MSGPWCQKTEASMANMYDRFMSVPLNKQCKDSCKIFTSKNFDPCMNLRFLHRPPGPLYHHPPRSTRLGVGSRFSRFSREWRLSNRQKWHTLSSSLAKAWLSLATLATIAPAAPVGSPVLNKLLVFRVAVEDQWKNGRLLVGGEGGATAPSSSRTPPAGCESISSR